MKHISETLTDLLKQMKMKEIGDVKYELAEIQVFTDKSGDLTGVPTKEIQEAESGNRNQRRAKWAKLRKKYKI